MVPPVRETARGSKGGTGGEHGVAKASWREDALIG